jgi:aspartate 1-decarboxylase
MCRAKIHRATITHSRLDYEGSIEIDEALLEAAGILENEMVLVANVENGHRFETYAIKALRHSGTIGLNGAAARLGKAGDLLIIMSVAWMEEEDARALKPQFIEVDKDNKILSKRETIHRVHA